jgi:hypothetical protein
MMTKLAVNCCHLSVEKASRAVIAAKKIIGS